MTVMVGTFIICGSIITCLTKENRVGAREARLDHSSLFPCMVVSFIVCLLVYSFLST